MENTVILRCLTTSVLPSSNSFEMMLLKIVELLILLCVSTSSICSEMDFKGYLQEYQYKGKNSLDQYIM